MTSTKLINLKTFQLEPFVISEMPPYVATSHVWSENLFPVASISSMSTTPGMRMVAAALQELNEADRPQYCWADTWCIDQSDPDDKLRQIPLMANIYRDAQSVIITVNHTFAFTQDQWDSAISACQEILDVQRLPGDEYQASDRRMGCLTIQSVKGFFQAYAMIVEIASLPWASRIWTVQEYILAKAELFIGMDARCIRVAPADMTTIFSARWARRDILAMFESYIGVPQDFPASEEAATENLDMMNRIKEGRVHAVKSMLLAGTRNCTMKEDEIYGLMGASGVVFNPSKEDTLDSAWIRWWEESLRRENLLYALFPVLEAERESIGLQSWNCIMPPTNKRCDFGAKTLTHKADSWGETEVNGGTLSVLGRRAGTCYIDQYLCYDEIPGDVEGLSDLCGHDENLALRICLAVDMGQRSQDEITTAAQSICAQYRLKHFSNQLDEAEKQRLETISMQFEPPPFRLQCYTKVYLGHITNNLNTTNILLITGEELPTTGKLLALDLIKRTDIDHPNKQLMVVRVPDDPSLPLHKVGMTYPVQLHEGESNVSDCPCYGHAHCEPFERFRIGGLTCEYCNRRRQ
ncbi:hypothetical protein ACEPPN_009387 [Leptodophora sp. 'Broadleaf-Isolate-01']